MQLVNFNHDLAASQTTYPSSKLTHTLIYRGVSYELSKHCSIQHSHTLIEIAKLIGKPLIYRGMHYAIAATTAPTNSIVQKPQSLIYRGATYVINAA